MRTAILFGDGDGDGDGGGAVVVLRASEEELGLIDANGAKHPRSAEFTGFRDNSTFD
jgi:hypothetical protein